VWLQRWELWSESIDEVGYCLLHALRDQRGESESPMAAPATLLGADGFTQAIALSLLPAMFQWDVLVLPVEGRFSFIITHHGELKIFPRQGSLDPELVEHFVRHYAVQ
jgi:hypothetical protein